MLLKVGTNFQPHENLLPALRAVDNIFKHHGQMMIITSLKDREHSAGSKHYIGKAFDLRIRHIGEQYNFQSLYEDIENALTGFGKIIDEKTHWHIEVN